MHSTMIILGSFTLNQVLSYVAAVIIPILAFLWAVFKDSYTIISKKTEAKAKLKENDILSEDNKPTRIPFFGNSVFKRLRMQMAVKKADEIAQKMIADQYNPTLILGIGRGGAIFGSLISYHLHHTPMIAIDRYYDYQEKRLVYPLYDFDIPNFLKRSILLVAGEIHTSGTMERFRKHLLEKGAKDIKTCVFYKQNTCPIDVDYVGLAGEERILMPWQDADSIRDSLNSSEQKRLLAERQKYNPSLTIYLVRHAETDLNAADRFIGRTEVGLSAKGAADAQALGQHFKVLGKIDHIYSSPSGRCLQTAKCIADAVNIQDIDKQYELREMDYGDWEGVERKEIRKNNRQLYDKYKKDPFNNYPVGGESPSSVKERMKNFWALKVLERNPQSGQIVIVTHKTAGRILLNNIIEGKNTSFHEKEFDNASVTKIIIESGEARIDYENDTSFLPFQPTKISVR